MNEYNWKPEWWIDGMSLLCLAHRFCRANASDFQQFRRHFDVEKKLRSKTAYNYDAGTTSLDLPRLLGGIGVDAKRGQLLFPAEYCVANCWGEIRGALKYCPTCLGQGIHLSMHQLSWLMECPVHDEPLHRRCHCGSEPKYSLLHKSRSSDALCRCGELNFGEFVPFSESEVSKLARHSQAFWTLRNAFGGGFDQFRVSAEDPDRRELDDQLQLTAKVLRVLLDDVPTGANRSIVRSERIDIRRYDFRDSRRERFRLFCKHAMRCADDSPETWSTSLVARLIEEEYFGDQGRADIRDAMQRNGLPYHVRDDDVSVMIEIFSLRLLECVARGQRPVRATLHPDITLAMRMVGEPLCQVIWQSRAQQDGTAYWLDGHEDWPESPWRWLNGLVWYLVDVRFNRIKNKYRVEYLERTLDEPAFVALFDNNDPVLGGQGGRQRPLFNWLDG